MNRSSTLRLRADLALMAVALIWGSTFVIVKEALEQVSTLLFLALRFALAAGALAVIYRFRPGIPEHHQIGPFRPEPLLGPSAAHNTDEQGPGTLHVP